MSISYICPNPRCLKPVAVAEQFVGQAMICPHCRSTFQAQQAAPPRPVAAPPPVVNAPSVAVSRATLAHDFPPSSTPGPAGSPTGAATKVGRFEIREQIGAGAFGTVYRAFDPVLQREVALKVSHPAVASSPEATGRALREPKAAAQLRHPNIVPIYDAGFDGAQMYLASAYIRGRTLEQATRKERFDRRRAAEIVRKLAEALHYAHRHGIVHRDVKPANVMLDEQGEPHLMDFGLASWERADQKVTQDGSLLGTPAYMSPEQAGAAVGQVGPASDQYGLGVLLYEMLCGKLPFTGPTLVVLFQIREKAMVSPRVHDASVPRDLETICLKAAARSPTDRYRDCGELAEDLRRFVVGDAVTARRTGPAERFVRWCRRQPVTAALAVSLAAALLLGFAVSTIALLRLRSGNEQLRVAKEQADASADDARRSAKSAIDAKQAAVTAKQQAEQSAVQARQEQQRAEDAAGQLRQNAYYADVDLARIAVDNGDPTHAEHLLKPYIPTAGQPDLRHFEWHALWNLIHRPGLVLPRTEAMGRVWSVDFSPNDDYLAINQGATAVLWDVALGKSAVELRGHKGTVTGVAYLPDGRLVTSAGYSGPGELFIWDVSRRQVTQRLLENGQPVICLGVARNGNRVICGTATLGPAYNGPATRFLYADGKSPGSALVFDSETGEKVAELPHPGEGVVSTALSPDGSLALTGASSGIVRLWNVAESKIEHVWEPAVSSSIDYVWSVEFSPDGGMLAFARGSYNDPGDDVYLYDVQTKKLLQTINDHQGNVFSIRFSHDGRRMATASWDRTIRLWRYSERQKMFFHVDTIAGHGQAVRSIAFSHNDLMLASGTFWKGEARLWDVSRQVVETPYVVWSPDRTVSAGVDAAKPDEIVWVDHMTGECKRVALGAAADLTQGIRFKDDAHLTARGRLLCYRGSDQSFRIWNVHENRCDLLIPQNSVSRMLAFINPGRIKLIYADGRPEQYVDLEPDKPLLTEPGTVRVDVQSRFSSGYMFSFVYSEAGDGRFLANTATGAGNQNLIVFRDRVTEERTQIALGERPKSGGSPGHVRLSSDGRLVSLGGNGTKSLKIWDARQGTLIGELKMEAIGFAFSRDGTRLFTGGSDQIVRCWSVPDLKQQWEARGHTDVIWTIEASPTEDRIFSHGWDDGFKIWDSRSGRLITTINNTFSPQRFSTNGALLLNSGSISLLVGNAATIAGGASTQPPWPPVRPKPIPAN